jgi:hypothetical protein
MLAITLLWTYWSMGEMYHEGWWGAWYNRLPYLIPGAVCAILTAVAVTWPRLGGWLGVVIGVAFTVFFMGFRFVDGRLTVQRELGGFLVSGSLAFIGVLFLLDGRYRRRVKTEGTLAPDQWWRRKWRLLLALGAPAAMAVAVSAYMLPVVLTRIDDGNRSERLIEGNGVTLVWAPEGPGWNWQQPWGGYPSWDTIALYGHPPLGVGDKPGFGTQDGIRVHATQADMAAADLCRFLSPDGRELGLEPQDVWRMPTVDELVRSLARHGENAGCAWNGNLGERMPCDVWPDKESPLWSTEHAPVYYWAAEEYDDRKAYFVSYNGFVNAALKSGGNPRHSHRCVREP